MRTWTVGVVLALGLAGCAAPQPPPGQPPTTTTAPATTAPPTTTTAPSTAPTAPTPSTTNPAPTTTTTSPPPADPYISTPGYLSTEPRVAVDRDGDALVVWVRTGQDYPYQYQLEMRARSRDGAWGPIVALSAAGQVPASPTLAVDDDGDAVVAWRSFDGNDHRVNARRVSRTGSLGPLEVLSGSGVDALGTAVAVDPDGDAVVAWAESHSDGAHIPKARQFGRDGSLSPEILLSANPTRAETPAVAIDREGDAVLTWANDWVVQARTLSASGTPGELEDVSADLSPIDRHSRAQVTVDRDGDALVTWMHWSAAGQTDQVWGRRVSRDGTLGEVRQLTPSEHTRLSNYALAGDLDGDIMLVWDRFPSAELYARPIPRAAPLPPPVLVSQHGRLNRLAVDDDGDGVVVFHGEGIGNPAESIRASRVNQRGEFEPPVLIAQLGEFPQVAVSPAGGAILMAWERMYMADRRIEATADLEPIA
jgi:hypothetical protein